MAPDKIYIGLRPSGVGDGVVYTTCSNDCPDSKAYIRKDTLMEWAKEMKRICKGAKPIEKAYQTVIDKIESL